MRENAIFGGSARCALAGAVRRIHDGESVSVLFDQY